MKLSELTETQKQHLAWRLDHKTSCGMLTAIGISKGNWGDMDLVEIFVKAGDRSERSAKIHDKKVMNFKFDFL